MLGTALDPKPGQMAAMASCELTLFGFVEINLTSWRMIYWAGIELETDLVLFPSCLAIPPSCDRYAGREISKAGTTV